MVNTLSSERYDGTAGVLFKTLGAVDRLIAAPGLQPDHVECHRYKPIPQSTDAGTAKMSKEQPSRALSASAREKETV